MTHQQEDVSKWSFVKTFFLPALSVFLVPFITVAFYTHAQSKMNAEARDSLIATARRNASLTAEEKAAAIEFYENVPFTTMLEDPQIAAGADKQVLWQFRSIVWMRALAVFAIAIGILMFIGGTVVVVLSMYSPWIQYVSLSTGWHVLRLYGAIQTVAQVVMLVSLSYWMTALWLNIFVPKLILVVGIVGLAAIWALLKAIFRRIPMDTQMNGVLLGETAAPRLWGELRQLCEKLNTPPPKQVIAGIDDNFFVTELPLIIDGQTYRGRSLYVSLSLLKQLNGEETRAVLAHEMAHFSGNDTHFSKRIFPLLQRFDHYLFALYQGGITKPIYYCMLFFRGMYQWSLGKISREREFRADAAAANLASGRSLASALMRIIAYSKYRSQMEQDIFEYDGSLSDASISIHLEKGFAQFAPTFITSEDIGQLSISHPFDSHPPLHERLAAVGYRLDSREIADDLQVAGDGRWYHEIPDVEAIESAQWSVYEDFFRQAHAQSLPYRFLPSNDEERAIVERDFPPITIPGKKKGTLAVDYLKLTHDTFAEPVEFAKVGSMSVNDGVLIIHLEAGGRLKLKLSLFPDPQQTLDTISRYYVRYATAAAFVKQQSAEHEPMEA